MSGTIKNILYLSSWYPTPENPFLGNFIRRQIELLSDDYEVTVVHTVPQLNTNEVRIVLSEEKRFKEYLVYHPKGKNIFQKLRNQKRALKQVFEIIKRTDLLFTQIILPKGLQFVFAKSFFNCPWVHIEQGSYFSPDSWANSSVFHKVVAHLSAKRVDSFFAVSDFLRKDLKSVFRNKHIELIPNHVDLEAFEVKKKTRGKIIQFLHISTLDPKTKNPKGMFDACHLLKKKIGNVFCFKVVTDGEKERWVEYCTQLDIIDVVSFEGAKEWSDIPACFQHADVFILNSVYETFSIVLAESWATGTPTITTPVGIGFDLPQELGIQTEIGNEISLANAMESFIVSPDGFSQKIIRNHALPYAEDEIRIRLKEIINKFSDN
ncbi:MAG: glycosyltransferase [Crocinitomicaceae bacterium]|nr:glycosyltransferase [Crocinitomicaceae bacterium]